MRRVPSRMSDAPKPYSSNDETERLFAYHQATKHTYQSVRVNAHDLDWANQPAPFRNYEGSPAIELPPNPGFPNTGTLNTIGALKEPAPADFGTGSEDRDPVRLDAIWLSRLLWHSMAISAWKRVPRTGNRYSLRVNPSSGNLHPTETY